MLCRKNILSFSGVVFVTICVLGLTNVVISHFHSAIPLRNNYELWRINGEDGWALVIPMKEAPGLADEVLAEHVIGIGEMQDGFRVKTGEDISFVPFEQGKTMAGKERSEGNVKLSKPGQLRFRYVLKKYYWLFLTEAFLFLALGILLMRHKSVRVAKH